VCRAKGDCRGKNRGRNPGWDERAWSDPILGCRQRQVFTAASGSPTARPWECSSRIR